MSHYLNSKDSPLKHYNSVFTAYYFAVLINFFKEVPDEFYEKV
jgi:hypothetical protein